MSNKMEFETGDNVSHRGQSWIVVEQTGFLVWISRGIESKQVRANQIQRIESKR